MGRGCCSYKYCKISEAEKRGLHKMLLGQKEIIIIVGPPPLVPLILLIFPFPPFDLCAKSPAAQYFSLGIILFNIQYKFTKYSTPIRLKRSKQKSNIISLFRFAHMVKNGVFESVINIF